MLVSILIFLFLNANHTTKSRTFSESSYTWHSLWDLDLTNDEPTSPIYSYNEILAKIWKSEIESLKLTSHGRAMAEWIKTTYPEAPYMLHVANCESEGLIHRRKGQLLKRIGGSDKGVLQVNAVHNAEIASLKLNLNKDKDYFFFTRLLFDRKGTKDWYMSQHCWESHYNRINEILAQI